MIFIIILAWSCQTGNQPVKETSKVASGLADTLRYPQEAHLANMHQLTFGGDNAEAYFSFNSKMIAFQSNKLPQRISNGMGRTTCSYFMPGDSTILFASTHTGSQSCPLVPPARDDHKYVWPIYSDYDIYIADLKGNIIDFLTNNPGYDAEAKVSPKGDRIVFTSLRSGNLELYTMNIDGSDVRQVTDEPGYDGGAFFSQDVSMLVFRASRPKTEEEVKIYKELLAQGLVMAACMLRTYLLRTG